MKSAWVEAVFLDNTYPLPAAFIAGLIRGFLGDAVAQHIGGQRFDLARLATYTVFTVAYSAVDFWIYAIVFPRLFTSRSFLATIEQVLLDNAFVTTCIYFPLFYCFKGTIERGGKLAIKDDLMLYNKQKWHQIPVAWSFWVPMNMVTFGFIAPDWRVPFISVASLMWITVLSFSTAYISRRDKDKNVDEPKPDIEKEAELRKWVKMPVASEKRNWIC